MGRGEKKGDNWLLSRFWGMGGGGYEGWKDRYIKIKIKIKKKKVRTQEPDVVLKRITETHC